MRWPYFYIAMGTGRHPLAKRMQPLVQWIGKLIEKTAGPANADGSKPGIADTYHGKVVPLADARQLVNVREDIRIENLEKVIPYTRARDIVLKNPDHIAVMDCPCRSTKQNPCQPLDVCLVVGEPFVSYVLEHNPDRSRAITPLEAEHILKMEDERGHVHHAFFKDAILGRFYAICNCCNCCCGAMMAHRNGVPMLASSGYICEVDENLCLACGSCIEYCQFNALQVVTFAVVDYDQCMGCGVCVAHCPQDGLHLTPAEDRGVPLEIQKLMEAAQPQP
jgi:Pyruvate/2-oxoacid:ferredoxin oxidoreductase delta subunit